MTTRKFHVASARWHRLYLWFAIPLACAMLAYAAYARQFWRVGPPLVILALIALFRMQSFVVSDAEIVTRAIGLPRRILMESIVGVFRENDVVFVNYLDLGSVTSQRFVVDDPEAFVEAIRTVFTERALTPRMIPEAAIFARSYRGTTGTRVL